jgi:hypothetical protein
VTLGLVAAGLGQLVHRGVAEVTRSVDDQLARSDPRRQRRRNVPVRTELAGGRRVRDAHETVRRLARLLVSNEVIDGQPGVDRVELEHAHEMPDQGLPHRGDLERLAGGRTGSRGGIHVRLPRTNAGF